MIRLEAMAAKLFEDKGLDDFRIRRNGTTLYIVTECGKNVSIIVDESPKRLTNEERSIIISKIEDFVNKYEEKLRQYIEMSKKAKEKREEFNKFVKDNELTYYGFIGQEPVKQILDQKAKIVIDEATGDISIKCNYLSYSFTENEIKQMLEELDRYRNLFKKAYEMRKEYESIEEELEQIKLYETKC